MLSTAKLIAIGAFFSSVCANPVPTNVTSTETLTKRGGLHIWTAPWNGEGGHPGNMVFNGVKLVTLGGDEDRRINHLEFWCAQDVTQFIPWYGEPTNSVHDQYGKNREKGVYKPLKLYPHEYISEVSIQACFYATGTRICAIQLVKENNGHFVEAFECGNRFIPGGKAIKLSYRDV